MNAVAGVISVGIGICVVMWTRRWFFGSDENFWNAFGSKFEPYVFPGDHEKYQRYWNDKVRQLTVITWLMMGLLSTLLSYVLISLLFY